MSEMVERVARALFERIAKRPTATHQLWETLPERGQNYYRADARTAIAAMRQPTEAMLAVGNLGVYGEPKGAGVVWRTMIDEALK